jgi:YVTN family beta-propeller protein
MTLDARARAFAETLQRSAMGVDPVAGLAELLHRRRRRRITRVAAALAAATALAVVAWVGVRGSERVAPIVNPPPGSLGRVVATIPVGAGPVDVLVGQDAVWVANAAQGTVSRVDPATNTVTKTIRVGRNPVRVAAGFGSIWVANETSQTVSRIEARTGQPQATIPVTGHSSADDLAVGEGTVWVRSGNRLLSLDPATNTMADRTGDWEVGGGGIAVVDGLLWLSGTTRAGVGQLVRVDPATSRVVDRFPTAGDGALAVGGGSVWQAGITSQSIYRYDPTSKRLLAQIPVGVVAKHLTAEDGSLWGSSDSGRVTRIDMATNTVTGTFQVGGRAPAVAVGHGSVWILDTANAALLRVQTTGYHCGRQMV